MQFTSAGAAMLAPAMGQAWRSPKPASSAMARQISQMFSTRVAGRPFTPEAASTSSVVT
ncbi:hypothetical protein D9M69_707960 [compost metagenome]